MRRKEARVSSVQRTNRILQRKTYSDKNNHTDPNLSTGLEGFSRFRVANE